MKKLCIVLCILCVFTFNACDSNKKSLSGNTTIPLLEYDTVLLTIQEIDESHIIGSHFEDQWTINKPSDFDFRIGDTVLVNFQYASEVGDHQYETWASSIHDGEPFLNQTMTYLYPTDTSQVQVELEYQGVETNVTYQNGWNVTANPDGTIYDEADEEYPYLFWKGEVNYLIDFSDGYCIRGEETKEFLVFQLFRRGLTEHEIKDIVNYWAPIMEQNKYMKICFQMQDYSDHVKLNLSPVPDSILRIQMLYQPLKSHVDTNPPEIVPFTRKGFTVIECGGSEINCASGFIKY